MRAMRLFGYVLGGVFGAVFIVGIFFSGPIFYLLFLSVLLLVGATTEGKKEAFRLQIARLYFLNDAKEPLEEKTLYVRSDVRVGKVTSRLVAGYVYVIRVTEGEKEIACLKGQAVENLFYCDKELKIADCIRRQII